MEMFEIELFEPFVINGKLRPRGWKGIATASYAKLVQRAGVGKSKKAPPPEPEKKPKK